ncbi:MAG: hypothetical protein JSU70_01655 [Phycisphaerales bacterium]|nr:MAG: hypothetical protein JSU70_01655 [Phycisphaerales bacterium]
MKTKLIVEVFVIVVMLCWAPTGTVWAGPLAEELIGEPGWSHLGGNDFRIWDISYDIWDRQDSCYMVWIPVSGDTTIEAEVTGLTYTNEWAKAGVMFRESLDPGSRHVGALVSASEHKQVLWRSNTDDQTLTQLTGPGDFAYPQWVRLEREGDLFTGSYSDDGLFWSVFHQEYVDMPDDILVGLVVTSHNGGAMCTVDFDNVEIVMQGDMIMPLETLGTGTSIGTAVTGDYDYDFGSATHTLCNQGFDIWDNDDSFQYAYQSLTGDGEIIARVVDIDGTTAWAKAGVMIRETLDSDSRHAMMVVTEENRTAFQHRDTPGDRSLSAHGDPAAVTLPYWVKLVRSGDTFTAYHSDNGVNWAPQANTHLDAGSTAANPATIPMSSNVYAGLCFRSGDPYNSGCAVFDNVTITGLAPPPPVTRLWRPFWFLDAKVLLVPDEESNEAYAYTGFWGGWYPYTYHDHYYYPWYGPVSCHPCCWPLEWHYWWWDWPWRLDCRDPNKLCWWWWHPWRGGPHFWGFLDRLSYRYTGTLPRTTFWWSWYWLYEGKGRCLEVVTLGDEQEGGRILPLDQMVLEKLQVKRHQFNVNGKHDGMFSAAEKVRVDNLPEYYSQLGASTEDVVAFESSAVYQNLLAHSLFNEKILVQSAEFPVASPQVLITQSGDSTEAEEGHSDDYEIRLASPPELGVTIVADPILNGEEIDLGEGLGEPIMLHFPAGDVGPRTVTVTTLDDPLPERREVAVITHVIETEDPGYASAELPSVPVGIVDDEDPAWLHDEGDLNQDGTINFADMATMASYWLDGCEHWVGGKVQCPEECLPPEWDTDEHRRLYVKCPQNDACTKLNCACNLFRLKKADIDPDEDPEWEHVPPGTDRDRYYLDDPRKKKDYHWRCWCTR